jgi:diacylglycerol kinase (ATP)
MRKEFKLKKRALSFKFAFDGIVYLLKNEPNALIHVIITFSVIVLGLLLNLHATEWSLVLLAIGLVLMAEAMNSAIEKIVDRISPEKNDWAGRIKDLSAAGVLLAAFSAAMIGLIIFIPKLIALL